MKRSPANRAFARLIKIAPDILVLSAVVPQCAQGSPMRTQYALRNSKPLPGIRYDAGHFMVARSSTSALSISLIRISPMRGYSSSMITYIPSAMLAAMTIM